MRKFPVRAFGVVALVVALAFAGEAKACPASGFTTFNSFSASGGCGSAPAFNPFFDPFLANGGGGINVNVNNRVGRGGRRGVLPVVRNTFRGRNVIRGRGRR